MDNFHKLTDKIDGIIKSQNELSIETTQLNKDFKGTETEIDDLTIRLNNIMNKVGCEQSAKSKRQSMQYDTKIEVKLDSDIHFLSDYKTAADKAYDMNKVDVLVACLAGGLAVLVDFIVVKTPKNIKLETAEGSKLVSGSPLTELFKKIGVTTDGGKSEWVRTLEEWFPVGYDKSISDKVKGMYPKNHRAYSIGHEPSIMGLIWGVKDIICGTFSSIDKNGVLCIEKVDGVSFRRVYYAPLLWLGHIFSDMFTKAGVPIPGTCMLRKLQFGSIGEKERTIGDIVEFMYTSGYDVRHLATAATLNVVIELIIRLYMYMIGDVKVDKNSLLFEKEYNRVKNNRKKHNLLMTSYSIAVGGNIAKVAAYNGSPNAINIPIWYAFAKESVAQIVMLTDDSNVSIKAIEGRHLIDDRFEQLLNISTTFSWK